MACFQTSIIIQCPVADVFALVSNYQNSSLWVAGALEHQQVTPGPIGVGTVIRTRGYFMGQTVEATRTVIAYDPPVRYAFRSAYRQVPFTNTFVFEPLPTGTRLTINPRDRSPSDTSSASAATRVAVRMPRTLASLTIRR